MALFLDESRLTLFVQPILVQPILVQPLVVQRIIVFLELKVSHVLELCLEVRGIEQRQLAIAIDFDVLATHLAVSSTETK